VARSAGVVVQALRRIEPQRRSQIAFGKAEIRIDGESFFALWRCF
jgi:hypothetical protein